MRGFRVVGALAGSVALALMPTVVLAQDADSKPTPIDPKTAAAQNQILGVIGLMIVLAVGWYYLRRWQIVRAARKQDDQKP